MSDQKALPHNLEFEQRTLGASLIDDEAVFRVAEILQPEDFYSDKHRKIYNAIFACRQQEGATDTLTVIEYLRKQGELDKVGGASYIANLAAITPTATNVTRDARRVFERAIYRRVINWLRETEAQAYTGVEDMREWFGKIQYGFLSLADVVREKKSPHVVDIVEDLKRQWKDFKAAKEKIAQGKEDSGKYCQVSLLKPFNAESPIPYYMPGHLWMIGGYTSVGKSTVLAQLLCDATDKNAKSLIFSLEESRTTKIVKMIANLTDIPQRYLLTGELSHDDETLALDAGDYLKRKGIIIYDDVRTLDEICLKTKKHVMKNQADIVAIDYVQNIQGSGGSIYNEMRVIGPTLLDLAVELGITIIALSQVTNESMREESQIIGLKGAGEFAAAADIVLWLKRIKGNEYALDCEIRKNRPFGQTGIVPLTFSERYTRIMRRQ